MDNKPTTVLNRPGSDTRRFARQQRAEQLHPEIGTFRFQDLPLVELGLGLIMVVLGNRMEANGGGSMTRTLIMFGICGLVSMYGFLFNPYSPIYMYAFIVPLSKAYGTGFALMFAGVVLVLINPHKVRWKWQFSMAGLAFCLWGVLSLTWAEFRNVDNESYIAQAWGPMILGFVISGIRDLKFRRNIFMIVALACIIGATASLRNFSRGFGEMGSGGRYYAMIRPDTFSAWLLLGFFGAIAWILEGDLSKPMRWILIFVIPYQLLGLALCGFRAAILAAGLGLIVVSICRKQFFKGLLIMVLSMVPIIILNIMIPSMFKTITKRFETIGEDGGSERLDIWTASMQLFQQHPIIGFGSDNFRNVITRVYKEEIMPHSIYVGTTIELGLIGLALMLIWFAVVFMKSWRSPERLWLVPLLVAYLFQAAFLHQFYFPCFWLALGLFEGASKGAYIFNRKISAAPEEKPERPSPGRQGRMRNRFPGRRPASAAPSLQSNQSGTPPQTPGLATQG